MSVMLSDKDLTLTRDKRDCDFPEMYNLNWDEINKISRLMQEDIHNDSLTKLSSEDIAKITKRAKVKEIKNKKEDAYLSEEIKNKVNKIIAFYKKEDDPDLNKMYDELLDILPTDSKFYEKVKKYKHKLLTNALMPYESLRKIEKKVKEKEMEEFLNNSYDNKKKQNREHPKFDREKIMQAVTMLLEAIGDDPKRPGLIGTPDRVARMWEEMFEGMAYSNDDIAKMFNTCFETDADNEDLVTILDIPVFSTCEHHIALMYDMTVSIGYIPRKGKVIGLSKAARVAEMCAHRLQLQEKLGEDIAEVMMKILDTPDIIVVIKGKHSCMTARGAKSNAVTKTATLKGRFKTVSDLRKEFYSLLTNN